MRWFLLGAEEVVQEEFQLQIEQTYNYNNLESEGSQSLSY